MIFLIYLQKDERLVLMPVYPNDFNMFTTARIISFIKLCDALHRSISIKAKECHCIVRESG